ncbi:DUF3046 domain-containing protein [uncultured Mobiluncus sp.]|uniref:DUF3046 domain-containing protein n=1 Tax=uncultured Mobiluncus sp. TaxID=293425 RepID=UPI00262F487B|nr:DUF3046 domain-containing protein [uncultured Mobiluncus sp.]
MPQFQGGPVQRGMTRSQFKQALTEVFPHGLGETLASDQVLTEWGMTALQALERGADPLAVWQALLRATDRDTEENLFWHRRDLHASRH